MTAASPPLASPRSQFLTRVKQAKLHFGDIAAIDLASIMTGVIVIGMIASVIAATVGAVIPWSQDQAAQGSLASIKTAEGAARVQQGRYLDVPALVTAGYLPSAAQASAAGPADVIRGGRGADVAPQPVASLRTGDGPGPHGVPSPGPSASSSPSAPPAPPASAPATAHRAVSVDPNGGCYVVAVRSESAQIFWATSDSPAIHQLQPNSTAPTTSCAAASFPAVVGVVGVQQATASGSSCTPGPALPHVISGGNFFGYLTAGQPVSLREPDTQLGAMDNCTYQPASGSFTGATIQITVPAALIGATAVPYITGRDTAYPSASDPTTYTDQASDWTLTGNATVGTNRIFTFTDSAPVPVSAGVYTNVLAFNLGFDGTAATTGSYGVGYQTTVGSSTATYNVTIQVQ